MRVVHIVELCRHGHIAQPTRVRPPQNGRVQPIEIADPADERLADFRDLTDADVRPDRRGIVIAEGVNVVQRLIASRYPVRAVIGVPSRIEAAAEALSTVDAPVYTVDKWLLSDVVGFRVTRGILASASRPAPLALPALLTDARRLAVLESLN